MSWDSMNADAILKACTVCLRTFYFTDHQQAICVKCTDAAAKAAREAK